MLPRNTIEIHKSAVSGPETEEPLFGLVGTFPFPSSDHRLVWIDAKLSKIE
jgi:hypothetical protein